MVAPSASVEGQNPAYRPTRPPLGLRPAVLPGPRSLSPRLVRMILDLLGREGLVEHPAPVLLGHREQVPVGVEGLDDAGMAEPCLDRLRVQVRSYEGRGVE